MKQYVQEKITVLFTTKQFYIKQTTNNHKIQALDLRQAPEECGRGRHVCERSTLPLTEESGATAQHRNKL